MAASACALANPSAYASVNFSKFIPLTVEKYQDLRDLVKKLRQGRILHRLLERYYKFCPALATKLETDLSFREYVISEIDNVITTYDPQFRDLADLIDKFQKCAWSTTHPSLFSILLSDNYVDFSDPAIVKKLEKYYGILESGNYTSLASWYLAVFAESSPFDFYFQARNLREQSVDHLVTQFDNFFTKCHRNQDFAHDFFTNCLEQGEYEIFQLFFAEAVRRKDGDIISVGAEAAIGSRNLDLVKSIFDPESEDFHVDYHLTSKEVYDYCSKLWTYNVRDFDIDFNLEESIANGDYEMYQINLNIYLTMRQPNYRKLMEITAQSGSIEIYQDLESRLDSDVIVDYDLLIASCFAHNCVDLALWLKIVAMRRKIKEILSSNTW